jgi:tetratricopeptide (TPR) repeat protein
VSDDAGGDLLAQLIKGDVTMGAALGFTTTDFQKLVDLGRAHLVAGRGKDARKVFDGLVALEPDVAAFHQLAGMAAEACGDLAGADRELTDAIHRADDHSRGPVYLSRALVRMKLDRHHEALADFAVAGELCDVADVVLQQTLRTMGGACAAFVAKN